MWRALLVSGLLVVISSCSGGGGADQDSNNFNNGNNNTGGTGMKAADFKTINDFINNATVVAALNDSGFSGVCVGSGVPAITGQYRPAMKVVDCGGCQSSIGNENDPSQVIWYCNQSGGNVDSWTSADAASGAGSQTILGLCPAWEKAGPDEIAFTIYGATDGEVETCSLSTVNVTTYIYNTKFGSATWGEALDVIVRIGSGCAEMGVTTKAGDWFLWRPAQDGKSPLARLGDCEGESQNKPKMCGVMSNQTCGDNSQCADAAACMGTSKGSYCLPTGCGTCSASGKACAVEMDCSDFNCQ